MTWAPLRKDSKAGCLWGSKGPSQGVHISALCPSFLRLCQESPAPLLKTFRLPILFVIIIFSIDTQSHCAAQADPKFTKFSIHPPVLTLNMYHFECL